MNAPRPLNSPATEHKTFLILLVVVTLAFGWILLPFYGAVFWGIVLAIVFAPLYRRLLPRLRGNPNLAALATLVVIVLLVVLPLAFIGVALMQEGTMLYKRLQSGELNVARYFQHIVAVMPDWLAGLLDHFGLEDLAELEQKLTAGLTRAGQAIATHVFDIGQNTLDFLIAFFVTL